MGCLLWDPKSNFFLWHCKLYLISWYIGPCDNFMRKAFCLCRKHYHTILSWLVLIMGVIDLILAFNVALVFYSNCLFLFFVSRLHWKQSWTNTWIWCIWCRTPVRKEAFHTTAKWLIRCITWDALHLWISVVWFHCELLTCWIVLTLKWPCNFFSKCDFIFWCCSPYVQYFIWNWYNTMNV